MWHSFVKFLAVVGLLFVATACATKQKAIPEKHYQLSGVVLSLNARDQTANIKHDPIEGWMEGMTMDYPIRSKQEFDRLHAGDKITATVNVRGTDYDLTDIRKSTTQ
jgi:Cu/Ag efflux protein CusF